MSDDNYYLIMPASGKGSRMNMPLPKQYLMLDNGSTVLDQSLATLLSIRQISGCVIAISEDDEHFSMSAFSSHDKILTTTIGGDERFHSVLNALNELVKFARKDDWVLVHDAVRPCIKKKDVERLIKVVDNDPVGGILATSIVDTLKMTKDENIVRTVNRNNLFHAQTPQMFRIGILQRALEDAFQDKVHITDEAEAIERLGYSIKIIPNSKSNIKITHTDDLELANYYLNKE